MYRASQAFAAALAKFYMSVRRGQAVTGCLCKALYPFAPTQAFTLLGTPIGLGDTLISAVGTSCAKSQDFHFVRS